jgi:ABC-type branched-subunit amino acid transport system ATPase component
MSDLQPSQTYFAVDGVSLRFGGLQVLDDVNFGVGKGEIVGLIGPNGAGKTTLFDVISGFHSPNSGHVWLRGTDLMSERPYRRAWLGLDRMHGGAVRSLVAGLVGTRRSLTVEAEAAERATVLIDQLGLGDYAMKMASELSYGTLRLTELATILAMEPELVLLDEPSSGIAQRETEALGPLLLDLRKELGATFLLIEHDMPLIMGISDRIVALAAGRVLAEGPPEEIQANDEVVEAYLGGTIDLEGAVAR